MERNEDYLFGRKADPGFDEKLFDALRKFRT
jgi:hypothetical protein